MCPGVFYMVFHRYTLAPGKNSKIQKKRTPELEGKFCTQNISRKNSRPLPPRRSIDKKFFFIFFTIVKEADFVRGGIKNLDFFQKIEFGNFQPKIFQREAKKREILTIFEKSKILNSQNSLHNPCQVGVYPCNSLLRTGAVSTKKWSKIGIF